MHVTRSWRSLVIEVQGTVARAAAILVFTLGALAAVAFAPSGTTAAEPAAASPVVAPPPIVLPAERHAYFIGERVPIDLGTGGPFKLEAEHPNGKLVLYEGPAAAILLDTRTLAPGEYRLFKNGIPAAVLHLTEIARRSAGSMQDETSPHLPNPKEKLDPAALAAFREAQAAALAKDLKATGVSAFFALGQADVDRLEWLDIVAREGVIGLANPDTRPTSFFPVGADPGELDSMSQRLVHATQANSRYPNFAGFCLGWDTTGYAVGNRRGLLTYWGWGKKTEALRTYLARIDQQLCDEFQQRTGLAAVKEAEYIAYLLSIKRPEFATAIDLPTRRWLEEIAAHTKPMNDAERVAFEQRLDAWSAFLMQRYHEAYAKLIASVDALDPAQRHTASVQVDHAPVRFGQYFPSAYEPLDFQYQSTWNDQVGGPDYAYQWLFTAGLLDMHRRGKVTWLSNTFGPVHARAELPGKFTRVAAHGLAYGVTGIGFALEGFSNLFGGMNAHSRWEAIHDQAGGADVLAGKNFLDRFAALAVAGRGQHGVGILFSKSQYQRQHIAMGFGTAPYQAFVTLSRLGYTPRFVTEEELAQGDELNLPAIVVIGQTFPLPAAVVARLEKFTQAGGMLLVDGNTTVELPAAKPLDYAFSFTQIGKPHNWAAPNITAGSNDAFLAAERHRTLAPKFIAALGNVGRGTFTSERGADTEISLFEIDAGRDLRFIVAVNDSMVKSQADWTQVRERLMIVAPAAATPAPSAWLYDGTAEAKLGPLAPFECDLSQTTARVYAVSTKELAQIDLAATQQRRAGEAIVASVRFLDPQGELVSAAIPFLLTLQSPDGKSVVEWRRSTSRSGEFAVEIPLAVNVPTGAWKLSIHSQLDGRTVTLPIQVAPAALAGSPSPAGSPALASPVAPLDRVLVRQRDVVEAALTKDATFVLPIFDSPAAEKLLPVAEELKRVLATRGVKVAIVVKPLLGTYTLGYTLEPAQLEENRRIEAGEAFGRIRRETVNGNDWFAAASGWRYPQPLLLLELSTEKGDNPLAESLTQAGMLWPNVTPTFPGPERGIVEGIAWAFAPRTTSIVLRAYDVPGLLAAAKSLAALPEDPLMPAIHRVKSQLWQGYHVGPPAPPVVIQSPLTREGRAEQPAPRPFAIRFPQGLPPVGPIARPEPKPRAPIVVPAVFEPKQFAIQTRDGEVFVPSATVEMLLPDLRFSDAIELAIDIKEPGKYRIAARGVFRYSDRKPCWQAQWEDVIELREKLVPKERRPASFAVRLNGKIIGRLSIAQVAEVEVPLELASASAGLKPKTAIEEVVVQLGGELELPAGVHTLSLAQENIVDGKLTAIEVAR